MKNWSKVTKRGEGWNVNKFSEKREKERARFWQAAGSIYVSLKQKNTSFVPNEEKDGIYQELCDILSWFHMENVQLPESAVSSEDVLETVLMEIGLIMRKITLSGDWWKQAALPILVRDKDEKVHALLPDRGGRYCKREREQHIRVGSKEVESYQNSAYCFYRPMPKKKMNVWQFVCFLLQSLSVQDLVIIFGISLLLELTGLIMPYINSLVYHSVIPSGTEKEIPGILVLVISSLLFSTMIRLSRAIWVTRIGNKMELAGQSAVWNRIFHLPAEFFKDSDAGELFRRADAVNQICRILGGKMIPALLTALLSVVYLFQISVFAEALVGPSIAILALLVMNVVIMCIMESRQKTAGNIAEGRITSLVYQLLGGITKIRMAGAETRAFIKWAEVYREKPVMPGRYLQIYPVISTVISSAGTIWLYVAAWQSGMTASMYIAFQTAFASFSLAVMALANIGSQIGSLRPAFEQLRPILEAIPENEGNREKIKDLAVDIEVSNVQFRYRHDMPLVLNGLKLQIKQGEYLGIVGTSGCGKSTLMRILLGFEKPESGTVYYGGRDIKHLDLPSLRRRIGVVLQNGKLFSGDIYSNIAICAPGLTMDGAWEAAKRAGFADDIQVMPMGMFTMLSEDGGGLSGGQKQRLLIARALAANPDILLFDEATSALDNLTQAKVVNTLENMNCTRLVIAHRLSTIKHCDRIICMDGGSIVEEGTYEELMVKNGWFTKMAERQLV